MIIVKNRKIPKLADCKETYTGRQCVDNEEAERTFTFLEGQMNTFSKRFNEMCRKVTYSIFAFFFKRRLWRGSITEFKTLIRFSNMLLQTSIYIDICPADILNDKGVFVVHISKRIVSGAGLCHYFVNLISVKGIRTVHIQTCHK